MRTLMLLLCLLVPASSAFAQEKAKENPLTGYTKRMHSSIRMILVTTAEKMPEEHYGFKPADTVRTFGQIVGHVADSQYDFCATILGEKPPSPQNEKTKTSKAELIAALNEAFAYCDKAFVGLNDTTGAELTKMMGGEMPKLGALTTSNLHSIEHYGNLVTYMRIKGLVPPTSEPAFMEQLRKK
jgi:uncharacterized damage-inducible protein DinB